MFMKKIIFRILIILILFSLTYQQKNIYAKDTTMVEVPKWLQDDVYNGIMMEENNFTNSYKNNEDDILEKCNNIDKKIRENYGTNPYSEASIVSSKINELLTCGVKMDGSGNIQYGTGKVEKWLLDCFEDNGDALNWVARNMSYDTSDTYYNSITKTIEDDIEKYISDGTNTTPTIQNRILYLSGDYINGVASRIVGDVLDNTDKRKEWYKNQEQWDRLQELLKFYTDENIGPAFTQTAAEDAKKDDDVKEDTEHPTDFKLASASIGKNGGGTLENPLTDTDAYSDINQSPSFNKDTTSKVGKILASINLIGVVIAVIVLVIIGIKYVLGSVEQKAEYKQTMLGYVFGAILLASGTTIVNVLYQFAQSL